MELEMILLVCSLLTISRWNNGMLYGIGNEFYLSVPY